jgi:UDP-N-acetylmuramyl pentapeptide phosphotransferase/UDP-N-acetylglucosamine-1-phosphate transferase
MAIPEAVSKRMVRRMALLCGIPTVLGIATFFGSYFLVTNFGLKLPNPAVVLVSMGFFGLGVLGLSYGVLSASWDEEIPGTKLGWQEFTTNLGRMTSAWRSAGQKD